MLDCAELDKGNHVINIDLGGLAAIMVSFVLMVTSGLFVIGTFFYMHLRHLSFRATGLAYFFYVAVIALIVSGIMLYFINDVTVPVRWFNIGKDQINQWLDQLAIALTVVFIIMLWIGLIWKIANYLFHRFLSRSRSRKSS